MNDIRRILWRPHAIVAAVLALAVSASPVESQESAPAATKPSASKFPPTRKLSPSEVATLEKRVGDKPNNLATRTRLLAHYFTERGDEMRAAGCPVVNVLCPRGEQAPPRGVGQVLEAARAASPCTMARGLVLLSP